MKLNSADFQKGGFDFIDSLTVASWLAEASVCSNLRRLRRCSLEKGGTHRRAVAREALWREAYFVDFAKPFEKVSIPIMVTGGLRRRDVMGTPRPEALMSLA